MFFSDLAGYSIYFQEFRCIPAGCLNELRTKLISEQVVQNGGGQVKGACAA